MSDELVSIIMPSLNKGMFLDDAINSVLGQSYSNLELLIVEGGSKDDSLRKIKYYQNLDERVKLVVETRKGVSLARNEGIAAARGKLIAFLDADDVYFEDKLERQVCLLKETGLSFCHGGAIVIDAQGEPRGKLHTKSFPKYPDNDKLQVFRRLIRGNFIASGSVMTSKSILPHEPFDTRLEIGEDWDLWARLARTTPFLYIADPVYKYRIHGGNTYNLEGSGRRTMRLAEAKVMSKSLSEFQMEQEDRDGVARAIAWRLFASRSIPAFMTYGFHKDVVQTIMRMALQRLSGSGKSLSKTRTNVW